MDAIYDHLLDVVKAPSQTCQARLDAFKLALLDPTNRLLSHDITEDLVAAWFLAIAVHMPETLPTADDYAVSMLFIECLPAKTPTTQSKLWLYLLWLHLRTQPAIIDDLMVWELPKLLEKLSDECYFWTCELLNVNSIQLEALLSHYLASKHLARADPWIKHMFENPRALSNRNRYARLALSHGHWDVYERCKSDDYKPEVSMRICDHGWALAEGRFRIASEHFIETIVATTNLSPDTLGLPPWLTRVAGAGWHDLFERLIEGLSHEQQLTVCQDMLMEAIFHGDEAMLTWIIQSHPEALSDDRWRSCVQSSLIFDRPLILKLLLAQRPLVEFVKILESAILGLRPQMVDLLLEHYEFPRSIVKKWLLLDTNDPYWERGISSPYLMPCISLVNTLWRLDLVVQWGNLNEPSIFHIGLSSPDCHGLIQDVDRERRRGSECRRYDLWMPLLRSLEARVCWALSTVLLVADDYFCVLPGLPWHRYISILNRLPFDLQIVVSRRLFGLDGVGYERASMNAVLKKLLAFLTDAFWSKQTIE